MAIETTICIKKDNLEILNFIARNKRISKSAVIRDIIILISGKQSKFIRQRFSAEYQVKDKGSFKKLHVYLNEPYFELALDLRRFYRASLSLLIAEAIELLYDELIYKTSNTDNYPGLMHTMIYYETEKSMCWKHIWGDPMEREVFR